MERARTNLDIAWRAHAAQESWAGKVDTKASILLALDGVILGAMLTARAQKVSVVPVLTGPRLTTLVVAVVLCAVAGLLAAAVVFPVLGGRRSGTIFFGDLRRRAAGDLAGQLLRLTVAEQVEQVALQLVAMSRVNWLKHRLMQAALIATMAGFLLVMIVVLT
ncbi:Pycsar system effector family protein [Actinoplanes sp. NPDC020271]|uniref:Pycsar system effector family protein n=1 Tax=Actinoplanes sp. NPDC020271 TaxID=3363896 RepID=UPI0037887C8B